jgi:hypothetical protein
MLVISFKAFDLGQAANRLHPGESGFRAAGSGN